LFRRSLRKRQSAAKKIHAVDPGLPLALFFVTAQDRGARLETAVCLELRRRARDPREGGVSYYVTNSGLIVDFAVGDWPGDGVPRLTQICAEPCQSGTRRQELVALGEAMGECGGTDAAVVTLHESGEERTAHGRMTLVPAWLWFLGLA
jgi:predicted AAA+ superfamily ATPase